MSTEEQTSTFENTVVNDGLRYTGMVKWFNNKAGFGFITVCGQNEFSNKDIFVHYSSIRVVNSQYKYLVQGEYVEFTLVKSPNEKHEYHATDISGILGGNIMCETRRINASLNERVGDSPEEPRHNESEGFTKVRPRTSRNVGQQRSGPPRKARA